MEENNWEPIKTISPRGLGTSANIQLQSECQNAFILPRTLYNFRLFFPVVPPSPLPPHPKPNFHSSKLHANRRILSFDDTISGKKRRVSLPKRDLNFEQNF